MLIFSWAGGVGKFQDAALSFVRSKYRGGGKGEKGKKRTSRNRYENYQDYELRTRERDEPEVSYYTRVEQFVIIEVSALLYCKRIIGEIGISQFIGVF